MASPRYQLRRRVVPPHGPWPTQLHPVVQRVLAARGVHCADDAQLTLQKMLAPQALGGIAAAVDLLVQAIDAQWRICIVGDFDCDGATGSAVAVRGLRLLGARRVEFRVPHRMRHGYGLSAALVAEFGAQTPDLLITVDNGVSSHAGVAAAKAAGMRVLITDHHLPGAALPLADAIVNPNLDGDPFPSKSLAGVGVMFYLLLALRARLRDSGRFAKAAEPDLASLLDLVALGTVADLVPLDHNNRILVAAGLARMRAGRCCAGIQALAKVAGRALDSLSSTDLGFAIGPRVNAAGRLEDMQVGIECLLEDNPLRALALAEQLHRINAERRDLQAEMLDVAESDQATVPLSAGRLPQRGVCLFDPAWHAGVVGLVASKRKEQLHRPVIAFAPAADDENAPLRGSARSIPGFHIRDALARIDAAQPGMIERFGGHAMAAGLTLPRDALPAFAECFEAVALELLDSAALQAELWSDGDLAGDEFCRDLAEQLRAAGPWGQAFPEPTFDGEFRVEDWRVVGSRHLKMRLRCSRSDAPVDAIHFGGWQGDPPPDRVHLLYQLEPDDYRDRNGVQLLVRQRLDPG